MGRGSNSRGNGDEWRRRGFDIHEIAQQVVRDAVEALIDECVAAFPRDTTLRVFDRKGGRRILRGEVDVTRTARALLHFGLTPQKLQEAWSGEPDELVRLLSVVLYGDEGALRCAKKRI